MYTKNEARVVKSNFWNELRVKNNYSYDDLASTLDLAPSTVAMWFCGRVMPKENHIHSLCELFGVDYPKGYEEFSNAHNSWTSSRPADKPTNKKAHKHKVKLIPMVSADPFSPETKSAEETVKDTIAVATDNSDIFRKVYGKLSYDEYESFRATVLEGKDPLAIAYNKLDFDDFMELYNLINS